jgi:hypothetical protein
MAKVKSILSTATDVSLIETSVQLIADLSLGDASPLFHDDAIPLIIPLAKVLLTLFRQNICIIVPLETW